EVLKNGSFEQNTLGSADWTGIWNMHNGTTLDHWTRQTDHGKYLMKTGNGLSLGSASDGEYFLNVIGRDTMIAGSPQFDMTQTFNVVIGETYTVSYDLASRPG